ncbi:PEP-CTERM sorting domain-containing protein [Paraglaciecola sp.]|uniref:PEP-CTERM sorting domain-containing protein n=1 Tax=Paraglaciecola sp. TaxID=1920173 RepID=UPI003EF9A688
MKNLIVLFVCLFSLCTEAAIITLDLDSDDQASFSDDLLQNGEQAFSGPLVVTFSNLITSDGSSAAGIDSDGLYFSSDPNYSEIVSVTLLFNIDVVLRNVDIDYDENNQNGNFWFTQGSHRSGNMLGKIGNVNYEAGAIPFFRANTAYTIHHNLTDDNFFQIDELILETVNVPEPSSLSVVFLSITSLFLIRRRSFRIGKQ